MRILIVLGLFVLLFYMFRGLFRPRGVGKYSQVRRSGVGEGSGTELVRDPYCQTYIPMDAAFRARMRGRDLFFCSEECMNHYLQEEESRSSKVG